MAYNLHATSAVCTSFQMVSRVAAAEEIVEAM